MLEALKMWLKLLAPFAPHICEELWNQMSEKKFISLAEWPRINEKQKDIVAEEQENLLKEAIDDTLNVLKATKITPKKICYYTASQWKWKVYFKILEKATHEQIKMNELMKELVADKDLKKHMGEIAKFASKTIKDLSGVPSERRRDLLKIGVLEEKQVIAEATGFLKERFKAEIAVHSEDDKQRYDPRQRAAMATPYRPAIYVE